MRSIRQQSVLSIRFIIVGLLAFLIDAGTYNLLVFAGGEGPLFEQPLAAKVIAIGIATIASYYGNKYFTYTDAARERSGRQFALFLLVNVAAILLQLSFLGFSRYVLGLTDIVADNLWGTVFGQAAALVFRYIGYGRWVFPRTESSTTD